MTFRVEIYLGVAYRPSSVFYMSGIRKIADLAKECDPYLNPIKETLHNTSSGDVAYDCRSIDNARLFAGKVNKESGLCAKIVEITS